MITLSLWAAPVMDGHRFDFKLAIMYILAQFVGAFSGALLNLPQQASRIQGGNPISLELTVPST